MLVKHTLSYLIARGIPGLLQFAALAIFTRLVDPEEYGIFVMVLAVVGLANAVGFQWLRLGLLRFYQASADRVDTLRATVAVGFLVVGGGAGVIATGWMLLQPDASSRTIILLGFLLLWAQAWFELNQEVARAQLSPRAYGVLGFIRAILYVAIGVGFTLWRANATGLLLGMLAGFAVPGIWMALRQWRGVWKHKVDTDLLRDVARYGLPLTATFVLVFVVSTSDRLLLGWMLNEEAAGFYGVGYDLAQNSIGMLLMIVNLSAYPLVLRALEHEGEHVARQQLAANGTLLLAVAIPASAGVAILAQSIASVCVGEAFEETTVQLLPWVALAALLTGVRAYHFDLSFHLSKKTLHQTIALGGAAVVNVVLNMLLIPRYGIMGAAYATVVAYACALLASWMIGRSVFRVPLEARNSLRIVVATLVMGAMLWPLRGFEGLVALTLQICVGSSAYVAAAAVLNVSGVRDKLVQVYQKRRAWSPNA